MAAYSKLYSDFQQRSRFPVSTNATGRERWSAPLTDLDFGNPPTVLLATEIGLVAQSVDRLALLDYDGSHLWTRQHGAGLGAVCFNSTVYYRGGEGDLYAVDAKDSTVLSDFFVPTVTDRGFIYMAMPIARDKILLHTFNRPEEPEPGDPPQACNYQLLLMGAEKYDDWDWMHEFEGECLPALVSADHKSVIVLNEHGNISAFDITSGEKTGSFDLPKTEFLQASVDNDNRLIIALVTPEQESRLCCYDLKGNPVWELPLESTERHAFHQPPAIGADNRVWYISGDDLLVIENGGVDWTTKVARAERRYVSLLEDGTALVTAASILKRFDRDGNELFTVTLEPGEVITAPAVVSSDGDICIATARAVHSIR